MSFVGNLYSGIAYSYHSQGQLEKAERNYRKALRFKTTNAAYIGTYGVLLMRTGRLEEALDVYQRALDLNPKRHLRALIRTNRAMCYYLMGQMKRALVALEDLHQNDTCKRVYETLGYLYIKAGKLDKALPYNLEALEYDDESPTILDNLGQTYMELGDWDNARLYFEKSYAIKQEQADILYHMGCVAEHEGRLQAAYEYYLRASHCKMDPLNDVQPDMLEKKLDALQQYAPENKPDETENA